MNTSELTGRALDEAVAIEVVIGAFYRTSSGEIVKTWRGFDDQVGCYKDDGSPSFYVTVAEMANWERLHIRDFPNARDPLLPYSFDLFWDIKHMSELKRALLEDHDDLEEIEEMMATHGITREQVLAWRLL